MRRLGLLFAALAGACGGGGGSSAAQLTIIAPAQDLTVVQGFPVAIRFTATDPDEQAFVRVVVDRDGNPDTVGDQTLLATLLEDDGSELVYAWQTAGVQPGQYTVLLFLLEANKPPAARVVAIVNVLTAPTLSVGQLNRTVIEGSDVLIAFNATDPADVATYAIYADDDCNFSTTADQIVVAGELTAQQNSFVWSTLGLPPASSLCIFITMDDGMNPLTVRPAGTVTLASDADLVFAPEPTVPFVPDVSILTRDPNSPDFYQLLWFDDLDDVAAGEIDISFSFTGQEGDVIWFGLELYSTVGQDILRDDMLYFAILPDVRWNGVVGTLFLSNDGAFPDFGLAFFEPDGAPGSFVSIPVFVDADPSIPADDFAFIFLGVPTDSFAFPTFTDDRSDFLVGAANGRFDSNGDVVPDSVDDTELLVTRYVNGP